ncbi:MAG: RNA-binding protein [Armatimonadetes bacterium]|nr:RNA-binding protein [Armatimonadota bacterium]
MATKSLYVGNLPYSTSEDDLRAMFEPYGPIEEIRVIQNKGFGFVDVPEENLEAAIEATNGQEVGGRTITVNEAKPREDRGSRGGGRGGFGGGRGGGGRGGFGGGGGRRSGW